MKRIVLAALAAFVLVCPAHAQQQVVGFTFPSTSGSLVTLNTDAVTLNIQGVQFASVIFRATSAGTATSSAQVSIDGGNNFIASAFAKRLSTVSANPTVQAISSTTLVAGDIWEVPLPANATHFRILCGASGTATVVSVYGGQAFTPGAPVTAVLFDTTSGTNTAIDTGTLDMSGWEFVSANYTTPAGGSGTISMVDDAGTSVTMFTVPASAGAWYPFAVSSPSVSQVTALPATGSTGALPIPKRMRFQSGAVAALTSRIRLEARR